MIKFEILTEDKPTTELLVRKIIVEHFDGFSITKQSGYWRGTPENSICITIITNANDHNEIRDIARQIKALNLQESVYIVRTQVGLESV